MKYNKEEWENVRKSFRMIANVVKQDRKGVNKFQANIKI